MNDRFDQGSLELEVSNFGPNVEAKIDLRPLTVFVGPTNTGKPHFRFHGCIDAVRPMSCGAPLAGALDQ